jgi:hypothetical protein
LKPNCDQPPSLHWSLSDGDELGEACPAVFEFTLVLLFMFVFVFVLPLLEPVPLALPVPVTLDEPVPDVAPVLVLLLTLLLTFVLLFVFDEPPVAAPPLVVEPEVDGLALPCADDDVLSCDVEVPCVPEPVLVEEL